MAIADPAFILKSLDDGQAAYPDALRFVLKVKDAGLRIAAASSSKNANAFLERIRLDEFAKKEGLSYEFLRPGYTLLDILDADVSGREFDLEWDKGKAVLYLLKTLGLDRDDVVPMYLGDDITDDPEVGGRSTSADYVLHTVEEVERFLSTLAR
jgi:hypothetical protein